MKKGVVIKSTGSWHTVRDDQGNIVPCRIRGKFRLESIKNTNPVAVGDRVTFIIEDASTNEGVITGLEERKNYIIRRSTNLSKQSQILAANIDQAILLITINYPLTTSLFIDRFLASAEAFRVPVVLLFNKTDRYNESQLSQMQHLISIYEKIGYQCLALSAKTQNNFDEVKEILKDKVTLIAGHSGVGKSTLINRLEPGLELRTKEISKIHETGMHTTTFAEMHPFSFGGYIIDTPGIRGFGLVMIEKEELFHFFKEIFVESDKCRFYNCTHLHEPGCAVKEAVESNRISLERYNSYVSIFLDKDEKYR